MIDAAGDVLAVVDDYGSFARALADRRRELGLSQLDADALSGLPDGYVGKIECGMRHLGTLSMPCLLQALGIKLIVVRDTPHSERQGREPLPVYRPQSRRSVGPKRRADG